MSSAADKKLPPLPADLHAAVGELGRAAERPVNAFSSTMEGQPTPPVLYHYTTGDGLISILRSGQLWMTDAFYLNDPSELRYGTSAFLDRLKERASNEAFALFAHELGLGLLGQLERIAHFFVLSFSTDGDELGQWRAYAENGHGFALGFEGAQIEKAFVPDSSLVNRATFPVAYDESVLRSIHDGIIDALLPVLGKVVGRDLPDDVLQEFLRRASVETSFPALRAALFFKHRGYRNEQEYRFFEGHTYDDDPGALKYRSRTHTLVRYREFDWATSAPSALTRVVIGPAADKAVARRFVEDCRRAFRRDLKVEIEESQIPYRSG